jgi:hypothetical protein
MIGYVIGGESQNMYLSCIKDLSRESKRMSKLLDATEILLKPINRFIRICDCSDRDDKPMVMRGCFLYTH